MFVYVNFYLLFFLLETVFKKNPDAVKHMRNRYIKLFFLVYLFIHNYVCEFLQSKYFYGQSIDKKKMPNENI